MLPLLSIILTIISRTLAESPDVAELRQEMNEKLEAVYHQLTHEINKLKLANNAIGFTAYRSTTYDVDNNAAVVFDDEILDGSNVYDATTGTFTCPVDGMYFIITTLYMGVNSAWYANLEMQHSSGTTTLGGIFNNSEHTLQSTNQAVIQCEAGSTIHVMNRYGGPRRVAGTEGGRPMSTFSGFLISLL